MDVDTDFRRIIGVREGLQQYYELEKKLDRVYLNSGRVLKKVGMNDKIWTKDENDNLSFVVVDSKPHLSEGGCIYLSKRSKYIYLITTNKNHPAFKLKTKYTNIRILYYNEVIDFNDAFRKLGSDYGIKRMTVQTGGDLNSVLIRKRLIDEVLIVIAPCLIGGKNTQSLIGGESLHNSCDLSNIGVLKLKDIKKLNSSYLVLNYEVLKETGLV